MAFILFNNSEVGRPDQKAKIIKAEDFWAYRLSSNLVYEAFQRHHNIVHAAESAFVAEQQRGYKEGLDAANAEQALRMMEIVNRTVSYSINTEQQFGMLVYDAVRQIINDYDDKEKVIAVVKSAMSTMRGQKHIVLKVNPENISLLENEIQALQQLFPMVNHIEVIGHADIPADSCIVNTEIGSAEASISAQMDALRASLYRVFGSPISVQEQNSDMAERRRILDAPNDEPA